MFIIMLLCFFILFIFTYNLFNKDLFSPPVIVTAVYCISGLSALYNYKIWELSKYNSKTVMIILVGLCTFVITSLIINIFIPNKGIKALTSNDKIISLSAIFCFSTLLMINGAIVLRILDIKKLCSIYGIGGSIFNKIGRYRSIISYSANGMSYNSPFILGQIDKIVTAIAYIFSYIYIKNIFNKDKMKHNTVFIIYIILFAIYSLLSGGRMPLLKLLTAILFYCYCLYKQKHTEMKNKKISNKFLKVFIKCLIVIIITFPLLHSLLGRNRTFEADYYITMYSGGPLKLFDMYIEEPRVSNNYFGQETLYGINQLIGKIGNTKYEYIKHLEFRTYKGQFLGNIYTPYRRYYSDFGLKGVIFLTMIYSIIINLFYLKTISKINKKEKKDIWILSYGLIIYTLFLYSIDDQFFTVICSTTYVLLFLFLYIIYKCLANKFVDKKRIGDKI